ncbi:flagellar export protein FliJ [Pantoea sp. BAV 3049]|uniref:flagellar export protein FliJ n=1 Tax=Pantoea sp. BAV 3049 TaxID=2654188 RepID=UPI00131C7BD0|nr:flagellar export protein FliJ [Pantoea sp. BAV 3049]
MDKYVRTTSVLERLRQMRERELEEATGRLAQQKILCQRYASNIAALTGLSNGEISPGCDAVQLSNQARFRANIQRVIDWQKQEQALAEIRQQTLQQELVNEACREKSLSVVLDQQRAALQQQREQAEQKQTDSQAMQSWMRIHRSEN